MKRSTAKKKWLAADRKLRAAFAQAVFEGKPAHVWQVVCERVSGAYKFSAKVVEQVKAKAKPRKKKEEA